VLEKGLVALLGGPREPMFHTCDRCDNQASFHLTEIRGGEKSERHLCEECAKVLQVPQANKELQNLLKSFDPSEVSQQGQSKTAKVCPDCGMTYAEFRQNGRFGCAKDYEVFGKEVIALLDRIHGSSLYSGKTPDGKLVIKADVMDEASEFRAQLAEAIEKEDYEAAARIRDQINQIGGRAPDDAPASPTEGE
jgi:protein arginine kinase activator